MGGTKRTFHNIIKLRGDKGVTILEMLFVLVISGVLAILATRYYMSVSYVQKLNQFRGEINTIVGAVANYKAVDPSLSALKAVGTTALVALYQKGYLKGGDFIPYKNGFRIPWIGSGDGVYMTMSGNRPYIYSYHTTVESRRACYEVAKHFAQNMRPGDKASCDGTYFMYIFTP